MAMSKFAIVEDTPEPDPYARVPREPTRGILMSLCELSCTSSFCKKFMGCQNVDNRLDSIKIEYEDFVDIAEQKG